jgi:putative solute:sodium symporter small subunit
MTEQAMSEENSSSEEKQKIADNYWRANLRLMGWLLVIWFAVSYGCGILFVEQLDGIRIGGFKLGFWFAQQGSIYVFVALIFFYVWKMNKIDREFDLDE